MTARAAIALVCAAGLMGVVGGCARAGQASGGGDKASFCAIYKQYDALEEPSPADPGDVLRYADGVVRLMKRVDPEVKVDDHVLPSGLRRQVKALQTSIAAFARTYRAAKTDAARSRAEARLTADARYARANVAMTAFSKQHCKKKVNNPLPLPSGGPSPTTTTSTTTP